MAHGAAENRSTADVQVNHGGLDAKGLMFSEHMSLLVCVGVWIYLDPQCKRCQCIFPNIPQQSNINVMNSVMNPKICTYIETSFKTTPMYLESPKTFFFCVFVLGLFFCVFAGKTRFQP